MACFLKRKGIQLLDMIFLFLMFLHSIFVIKKKSLFDKKNINTIFGNFPEFY